MATTPVEINFTAREHNGFRRQHVDKSGSMKCAKLSAPSVEMAGLSQTVAVAAAGTAPSHTATANGRSVRVELDLSAGNTVAVNAQATLALTNSFIDANSQLSVTVVNPGAGALVTEVSAVAAGSATVRLTNVGAATTDSDSCAVHVLVLDSVAV